MTKLDSLRLDIAVHNKLNNLSRASVAKLIEAGQVKVNSSIVTKPAFRVSDDDELLIDYDPTKIKVPKITLPIIYEDKHVIVINKRSGILTHSKGAFNSEATVASWLKDKFKGAATDRSGIVHRLDRLTSGVMILAKDDQSAKWLQKQFSSRKVKKTYIAIVSGQLNLAEAIIDLPIERNPKSPQSFRVGPSGKTAITAYKVLSNKDNLSLIELKPTTGRTHQLRVHLAHLGHPIVGDSIYKGIAADRLYLHALSLEITLPSKEKRQFEAPLPKEFKLYMKHD